MVAPQLAIALLLAFLLALAFFPAIRLGRRRRLAVLLGICVPLLLTPLLVPLEHRFDRLLAGIWAVALAAKLLDVHVGAAVHRPGWWSYVAFLPNLSSVVLRKLDNEPQPGCHENLRRLARSGVLLAGTLLLAERVFELDWSPYPFLLEHCVKALAVFAVVVPGATAAVTLWRLGGGKAREPMENPLAARTPADFWRRYNRPAQQFFYEDLYKPNGGARRHVLATVLTFAASAAAHEYLFDIAVMRIQGYQTAFFLVQGLAVATTSGIRPTGVRAVHWIIGTYLFELATTLLFFASVDEVVPFYSPRSGSNP